MHILTRGSWPKLKELTVIGIGGTPTQTALKQYYTPEASSVFEIAEERLRSALSEDTSLSWKRESSKGFYLFEGDGGA